MASKYSEKEISAIDEKLCYPDKEVICPRCGKKLLYKEIGNSCRVSCETDNCLMANIHGI